MLRIAFALGWGGNRQPPLRTVHQVKVEGLYAQLLGSVVPLRAPHVQRTLPAPALAGV